MLPWVDVATGSLGRGCPTRSCAGVLDRILHRLPYRVWALCGDSELAEGSIWEALDKASSTTSCPTWSPSPTSTGSASGGATDLGWDMDTYQRRAAAFGARVLVIDGHDLNAIHQALSTAADGLPADQPTVILAEDGQGARLLRGRGQPRLARQAVPAGHGRAGHRPARRRPRAAGSRPAAGIGRAVRYRRCRACCHQPGDHRQPGKDWPQYKAGEVATRKAYGDAPVALVPVDPKVVAKYGEVSNSTYASQFARAYPERYFETFIAEQQLVAATWLSVRGYKAFGGLDVRRVPHRAYDFIRMGSISGVDLLAGPPWPACPGDRRRRAVQMARRGRPGTFAC